MQIKGQGVLSLASLNSNETWDQNTAANCVNHHVSSIHECEVGLSLGWRHYHSEHLHPSNYLITWLKSFLCSSASLARCSMKFSSSTSCPCDVAAWLKFDVHVHPMVVEIEFETIYWLWIYYISKKTSMRRSLCEYEPCYLADTRRKALSAVWLSTWPYLAFRDIYTNSFIILYFIFNFISQIIWKWTSYNYGKSNDVE